MLRSGVRDPQWVLDGTTTPKAAARVALEWVEAGVEPTEVAGWLRAGCTDARWARKMERAGITPAHLVGADGRPLHVIDEGPDMEGMPLAQAVAEEYVTVGWAVKHLARRAANET